MSKKTGLLITHAALDEQGSTIVLRGVINPDSLDMLQVAPYQREALPLATLDSLVKAMANGERVPDIELGMRGEHFDSLPGEAYVLNDPVFIMDGLQRVTAATHLMRTTGAKPILGATIHFNTNEADERARFKVLNADRTKLSPNVLARNMRTDNKAVDVLYRLSHDSSTPLIGRVCWGQRQNRGELMTALTLMKTAGFLMGHIGPGRYTCLDPLAEGLLSIMTTTGPNVFRDNIRTFYDFVDEAWGIRRVTYKEGAVYLRTTFLSALAALFSGHTDFWRDHRLTIDRLLKRKLATFPITDPQVSMLAGSAGKSREMLYHLMVDHINSGKRTKRLTSRNGNGGMGTGNNGSSFAATNDDDEASEES